MQAEDLIELSAFLAVHQAELMAAPTEIVRDDLDQYWVASKCRQERWARSLKTLGQSENDPCDRAPATIASGTMATVVEVLTGEMLTRVWAALLCAHDEKARNTQASPIVRSVFQGHMEARHRVLRLLASGSEIAIRDRSRIDRLRRRSERWSDILLAHSQLPGFVADFAVDPNRAMRYARDYGSHTKTVDSPDQRWSRLRASIQLAFPRRQGALSRNEDLNRRIAASVLGGFPAITVRTLGVPTTLWIERLERVADDSERMIATLLALCGAAAR